MTYTLRGDKLRFLNQKVAAKNIIIENPQIMTVDCITDRSKSILSQNSLDRSFFKRYKSIYGFEKEKAPMLCERGL
jgi:hypothetical protein